jgi:hypothetical protein
MYVSIQPVAFICTQEWAQLTYLPYILYEQLSFRLTPKQSHGLVPASHDNAVRDIDANSCVLLWRVLVWFVDVSDQVFLDNVRSC